MYVGYSAGDRFLRRKICHDFHYLLKWRRKMGGKKEGGEVTEHHLMPVRVEDDEY